MSARLDLKWEIHRLDNGLPVILHEDHTLPQAAVNLWYHVGSKDEPEGRTGFAHLFEHLMFQGSEHCPSGFIRPLERAGGRLNGSTSEDRTNYWEVVPSEYLEQALFLESDRMGFLLPALDQAKLDTQREVVKNERRQTVENQPYGLAEEALLAALYPEGHPYRHSVIGSMADIEAATLEEASAFFRRFYAPNNASLCIAGDIEPKMALELAARYFGEVPAGEVPPPFRPCAAELPRPVRLEVRDRVTLPRLYLAWHVPRQFTEEDAALAVLAFVLQTGKDSRLVKRLQVDQPLAQAVWAYQYGIEATGRFVVAATAQPGVALDRLEAAAQDEISRVVNEGPAEEEVAAARAAARARMLFRLQSMGGFGSVSDMLNRCQTMAGDPGYLMEDLARIERVTPGSVQEAARKFLDPRRRLALSVLSETPKKAVFARTEMPKPSAPGTFCFPEAERRTLENGLEVWVLPRGGLPLVSVHVVVRAGSACDPPGLPGLADMTADLLDEGAAGLDSAGIARRLKGIAASLSTEVDTDSASFSMNLLVEHLGEGLQILNDLFTKPHLDERDFERLCKEHLADLARTLDSPQEAGDRALRGGLYGAASPYGHPAEGTGEGLEAVSVDECRRFHFSRYRPDRCLIALAGDFSAEEGFKAVERALGDWCAQATPADEPPPPPADARPGFCLVNRAGAPQAYLTAIVPAILRSDRRYAALLAFNAVVGGQFTSRINMNLREEKGITYGARSAMVPQTGPFPWVFSAAVQADRAVEAIGEVRRELAEAADSRPVTAEEFEEARRNLVLRFPQGFETLSQLTSGLAFLWTYRLPTDAFEQLFEHLRALTLEETRSAGSALLIPERLTWAVVGDAESLRRGILSLGLGPELDGKAVF